MEFTSIGRMKAGCQPVLTSLEEGKSGKSRTRSDNVQRVLGFSNHHSKFSVGLLTRSSAGLDSRKTQRILCRWREASIVVPSQVNDVR